MRKILLVDDHDYMFDLVSELLKEYSVFYAESVDKALNLLKSQSFDLVIVDLMMPKKSGFSLLPKLKKDNIPNITLSNVKIKRISDDILKMTNAYVNKGDIERLKMLSVKILNGIEV
jgi:CheY-like chemotaxis protein